MYYYVYRIDFEDGHYYIGSHQSEKINDNYIGSGGSVPFHFFHPDMKYTKTIISFHNNRKEAYEAEQKLIVPKKIDKMSLNKQRTGCGRNTFKTYN